jgi:hypothetical protein
LGGAQQIIYHFGSDILMGLLMSAADISRSFLSAKIAALPLFHPNILAFLYFEPRATTVI